MARGFCRFGESRKTCPQIKSEVKDASLLRKGSAGVIRSTDQGLTWQVFGNLTATKGESWLIENTVVEERARQRTRKKKTTCWCNTFEPKRALHSSVFQKITAKPGPKLQKQLYQIQTQKCTPFASMTTSKTIPQRPSSSPPYNHHPAPETRSSSLLVNPQMASTLGNRSRKSNPAVWAKSLNPKWTTRC